MIEARVDGIAPAGGKVSRLARAYGKPKSSRNASKMPDDPSISVQVHLTIKPHRFPIRISKVNFFKFIVIWRVTL